MPKKVVAGLYEVDFTWMGQRIRGAVPCDILVSLLTGSSTAEALANIGPQGIILFDKFVDEQYLPRHAKPNKRETAYDSDLSSLLWLKKFFKDKPVHLVTKAMREDYKQQRLSGQLSVGGKPCSNNTVNRELSCLSQVLEYATMVGYLKVNLMAGLKRLPPVHREKFWLRKEQVESLLESAKKYEGGRYLGFVEFLLYTGARKTEGLFFNQSDINLTRKEVRLNTLKKRKREKAERFISIKGIGPRLERLIARLKPHPVSGYFFATKFGHPWAGHNTNRAFNKIRRSAGLEKFKIHDLRHTYAMHRAMTRITFRQLQVELGHTSPQSIQSYLDQADRFEPQESLFYRES